MNTTIETNECVRCGSDDTCAYDGESYICWDCADKIKFNTAFTPTAGQFANLK